MSENSVIMPIEEDLLGAENSDDGESGEKVLLEFEEFANIWRSFVRVTNAILQYRQYEDLNKLLSYENLINFVFDNWKGYTVVCAVLSDINKYLLDKLKKTQTNNVLEEEQKNKDIKYVNDFRDLFNDIAYKKRNILTIPPPVPELDLQETAFNIENKGESKYKRTFYNLLHFYINLYTQTLSSTNLLETLKILFKNISSRRQQFDEFIRNFVINQECNEEVLQRWEELQQFLTIYFNKNPKEMQQNEVKSTKEVEQSSQFFLFLQSLLKKDELKWTKEIDQLLKDHQHKIHEYYYYRYSFKNTVEELFLILLLDAKFDFKNFIKAHEATIQKTLKDNFLKQWRRMLNVPLTFIQFQQCHIHWCNLKKIESAEWETETKKASITLSGLVYKIIHYVIGISIGLEILKNTSIVESDKLTQDSEYLDSLLKVLNEILAYKRNVLFPVPPLPKLNVFDEAHSSTSKNESGLNDTVFHLYHFYKLTKCTKCKYNNATIDFCDWNKKMLENISKNLDDLNYFVYNYVKNQRDEKDVLLLWEEFKIFLSENQKLDNNFLKTGIEEQSQIVKLYQIIFDKNRQRERELRSISPIDKSIIKSNEMKMYIIFLLNVTFDAGAYIRNSINLNSNLIKTFINKMFPLLLNYFKYKKFEIIIFDSYIDKQPIINILDFMQLLILKYNEDFLIYDNLLNQFQNILQDEDKMNSFEVFEEIEIMHQSIINLNNDENTNEEQKMIYNLYWFWKMFIEKENISKENFFQWNEKMFNFCFMKLNDIDLFINKFFTEEDKTVKMWKCFKKFLIKKYTGYQDETDSNEINYNVLFESCLHDNWSFPEEMENVLKFIKNDYLEEIESEIFYISILFDSRFSLRQMANSICHYEMSDTYDKLNRYKFIYFSILNDFNKIVLWKFDSFIYHGFEAYSNHLDICFNAYKTLNKNDEIIDCLKGIGENKIKNDVFYLDEVPQLPTDDFQLKMINNLFLIQYRQIIYLHTYFLIIYNNKSKEKSFKEKIQTTLKYIYSHFTKMDEFINRYFGNLETENVFQSNWSLIKITMCNLSLDDFYNCWQLFFDTYEKHSFKTYVERNINVSFHKFKSFVKIKEQNVIAQHVLLILLNVPLSKIAKSQYRHCTLNDIFFSIRLYKEILPKLEEYSKYYISPQYNLTMDIFLTRLENVSNSSEGENKFFKLLVKSEFNRLEKQEKSAIIEDFMNILQ